MLFSLLSFFKVSVKDQCFSLAKYFCFITLLTLINPLISASMIDMLTIRGVMLLDEKMEAWNSPILKSGASVSVNMFDKLTDPMQRQRFMTFCSAIHSVLRKNSMAVMLIALIVLFDDSRATKLNDSDRAVVRKYHEFYYHLLLRYVDFIFDLLPPRMTVIEKWKLM